MDQKWITPVLKQSFVTAGVSINMASGAIVMGFATGLMDQLKAPGSIIPTDDSSRSWIAAMPTFTMFVGNLIMIPIMGNYGRRSANLISIAVIITSWICVIFSTSVTLLLFARALQGIHVGMGITLGSLLIGEYTSPKNRGSCLMSISILLSIAYLIVHSIGSYTRWQNIAIVSAVISILNSIIVIYSPESPSWLAFQGRYDDSRRVFRWLRGDDEEEELRKLIEAQERNLVAKESKTEEKVSDTLVNKVHNSLIYFRTAIKKKYFCLPLIVMLHIYMTVCWGGMYILTVYPLDFFYRMVGSDANLPFLTMSVDVHRIIVNVLGIYMVRKIKRRTFIFSTVGINIVTLLIISAYSYARAKNILPFDEPMIPILLSHCLMFAIAAGTLPLALIISGEIFPLEFKNLAGGLSNITYSAFSFFAVKTIPYCFEKYEIHGTFCIYVLILIYSFLVIWIWLPETKDKSLQDIEEELRGRPLPAHDLKSMQPLTSLDGRD